MKATALALLFAASVCLTAPVAAFQKTIVTSADQLPRRSYQLTGTVSEILADEAQLKRLGDEMLANLNADLERLEIKDAATLSGYYSTMAILHAMRGEPAKALALVPRMRELEPKPAARLTTGMFLEVWARTRIEVPDEASDRFKQAFARNLAAAYVPLPYADIKEHVEANKAQASVISAELVMGNALQMQPMLDQTQGKVPEGAVFSLIGVRFLLDHRLPLKDEMLRVYTRVSDTNAATAAPKTDIWTDRNVTLDHASALTPVVIGIWDSGVDMDALPPANRFVNTRETVDGRDNDGNGFIDDVHGIAYDKSAGRKDIGTLQDPAGKITGDVARLQRLTKGGLDMQSGVRSPEAAEVQQTMSSLKREDVQTFVEELGFYTGYMHGTHVAGIAMAGNPAARILAARMSSDHRQSLAPYTLAKARFNAGMYRDTVDYFKRNGVRVVNMSWRYSGAAIEASLAAAGVGRDERERRTLAREMFEIEKTALYKAIKDAPGILFVCGSGNENNDADFSEYIPASFDLPNLVTVGAVDIEGRKAAFTTEGRSVDFYANGHEIESVVPGGARMRISGTSMASPQVANLAAKLLALHPSLKPTQIVSLIRAGSDPSSEDPGLRLINPKKTLADAAKETR
jgi:subtilisin family serine protease